MESLTKYLKMNMLYKSFFYTLFCIHLKGIIGMLKVVYQKIDVRTELTIGKRG